MASDTTTTGSDSAVVAGTITGCNITHYHGDNTNTAQNQLQNQPDTRGNKFTPDYLWYLPDRDEQNQKLRKAIQTHEKTVTHRPLLCFIYGDEQEAHYEFKDYFVEEMLPRISKFYRDGVVKPIKNSFIKFKNIRELHKNILDELTDKVLDYYPDDPKTAIADELFGKKQPVILCFNIYTEHCQYQKNIIEQGFIDFWANWPEPTKNKQYYRLLVFLLFHYSNQDKTGWRLTRFFKQSSVQQPFSQELNQLEQTTFSHFLQQSKVGAVVLPQLSVIQKGDAIQWLFNICQNKNPFLGEKHLRAAKTKIEEFYKKHPKGVPMETLAQTLKAILENVV